MTRFYKKFWHRSKKAKSPFGGEIATKEEVEALNDRIVSHEKAEFEHFEKEFDAQIKKI